MGLTKAQSNRAVRQEALRDQLSAQGHVQHVIDLAEKLSQLDIKLDATQVARLKLRRISKQNSLANICLMLKWLAWS